MLEEMQMSTRELTKPTVNGWPTLWLMIVAGLALAGLAFPTFLSANVFFIIGWALLVLPWSVLMGGFYTLQPNQAAVLVLLGRYTGTDRTQGFRWANPFLTKLKVSLRAR